MRALRWLVWVLSAGVAALVAFASASPLAHASVVRALSLAELVRESSHVLVAEIGERQARRGPQNLIVTDVSLEVRETLKGSTRKGEALVVTLLGGVLDGLALQVPGEASLPEGERMLLFLERSVPSGDLRVVGMAQGALALAERAGGWVVLPTSAHAALVVPNDEGRLQTAEPALATRAPLTQLLEQIAALVRAQAGAR